MDFLILNVVQYQNPGRRTTTQTQNTDLGDVNALSRTWETMMWLHLAANQQYYLLAGKSETDLRMANRSSCDGWPKPVT